METQTQCVCVCVCVSELDSWTAEIEVWGAAVKQPLPLQFSLLPLPPLNPISPSPPTPPSVCVMSVTESAGLLS